MTTYLFKQLDYLNNTELRADFIFVFTFANCTVLLFTLFVGLVANVFVVWAVIRQKSLQTSNNALLVNLAIIDLLRCVVDCPLLLTIELRGYGIGQSGDLLCDAQMASFSVGCCVQLLTLASISAERYQAVANPFENKKRRIRIAVLIILTWTVALLLSVLCMSRPRDSPIYMKCNGIHRESLPANDTFGRYIFIPIWTGCFSVITGFYGRIYWIVRTHNKKIFDKGVLPPPKKKPEIVVDDGKTAEARNSKLEDEPKKTENFKVETQKEDSPPVAAAKLSEVIEIKERTSDRLQAGTAKKTMLTIPVISVDAATSCSPSVSAANSSPFMTAAKQPEAIESKERASDRDEMLQTETAKKTTPEIPVISLDATAGCTASPEVVMKKDCQPAPAGMTLENKTVSFEAKTSVHAALTDLEGSTKMASEPDPKSTVDVKVEEVPSLPAGEAPKTDAQPNPPAAQDDQEVAGAVCMMPSQLGKERASKKKEGKLAKRSGYIILTFVLFWTPLIVSILVNFFVHRNGTEPVSVLL
ncbi:uncharacterized protein LOC135258858 isoform X2 [Anguilla rostrata]|uniref:uncharacterized protein LOC135258858 isoform X2 n=1 Tax=Anguilla rostrata TaxID=7938 RepID=UPI0030CF3A6F